MAKNHSWSHIQQNLARQFIKKGFNVDLFSTNGLQYFPEDLKPYLKGYIEENDFKSMEKACSSLKDKYDVQISYTAMKNFPNYLSRGNQNRFGIWCYEVEGKNILPNGFAANYKHCDKLLPPSNHAKKVFMDSGIPENHLEVIPHGVDDNFLYGTGKYKIKTNKKFKFLCAIGQPHARKNISGILEAYGRAFTNKDDVSLVIKIRIKKPEAAFEIDFNATLASFKKKYPNHGEIVIIDGFITDMSDLYRSCDSYVCLSNAESFGIPNIEAMATDLVLITSNHGGQLDFCNSNNSLLVDGKIIKASSKMFYWTQKPGGFVFEPDIDDAAHKMQLAFNNKEEILNSFKPYTDKIKKEYTWSNVSDKIIKLIK
jgi:glycosyltransferase involved in cell wall biosynthesis